jgi:photosystem II stability/assembly factor-like uncharacterized protein
MKNLNSWRHLSLFLLLLIFLSAAVCLDRTLANNPEWIDISAGMEGGPSLTLCFAPDSPNTLYAGVNDRGVYRMSDSGQDWTLLDVGLDTANSKKISVLRIDPVDPNIMFLGTKAGLAAEGGKWVVSDALYRSTDGGNSWTSSNKGIVPKKAYIASPPSVRDIAIDPSNHSNLYVATAEGVFRSTDGGANWAWSGGDLPKTGYSTILISPDNPRVLFALSSLDGVFKSEDEGVTWESLGLKDERISVLAMSPADTGTIYAAGEGIFGSTDGGKTWADLNLKNRSGLIPWVNDIEISSQNPSAVYLATNIGVFRSDNGGQDWIELKPSKLIFFWSSNDVALSQDDVLYSAANGFSKGGGLVWMWKEEGTTPPQESTGSIVVRTNLLNASFTITGPATYKGTGTVYRIEDAPIGEYTATFGAVEGYATPLSVRKTLDPGESITLDANYSRIEGGTVTVVLCVGDPMMYIDGVGQEIDPGRGTTPVIVPEWGRTVVPIRAIVESLGGVVSWDGMERRVTINFGDALIELQVDNPKARVSGSEKWIDPDNHDVKPTIINSRTMLPLRFVAENLGATVSWDGTTKAITMTYRAP